MRLGPSSGEYGGRVSTESGPWCLRTWLVEIGASAVVLGPPRAGLVECGEPVISSIQSSVDVREH